MSFIEIITNYEEAWKSVVMPERQEYNYSDLGLKDFSIRNVKFNRKDFKLQNKRGDNLDCSFYSQTNCDTPRPCIVFLHAHACSRLESIPYVNVVLAKQMHFCSFDFSGCGKSEGMYSTIGWQEQDDLECVINHIAGLEKVNQIILWGRSMGATTAIFYSHKDPRVGAMILDSAFADLKRLVQELAKEKAYIPGFLSSGALSILRKTILSNIGFDIDVLKPIAHISKATIPALFGTAKDDALVHPDHGNDLYKAYKGPKKIIQFEGDHNSLRPAKWMLAAIEFVKQNITTEKKSPLKLSPGPMPNPTKKISYGKPLMERKESRPLAKFQAKTPIKTETGKLDFSWNDHKINTYGDSPVSNLSSTRQLVSDFHQAKEIINNENIPNTPSSLLNTSVSHKFKEINRVHKKSDTVIYGNNYKTKDASQATQKPVGTSDHIKTNGFMDTKNINLKTVDNVKATVKAHQNKEPLRDNNKVIYTSLMDYKNQLKNEHNMIPIHNIPLSNIKTVGKSLNLNPFTEAERKKSSNLQQKDMSMITPRDEYSHLSKSFNFAHLSENTPTSAINSFTPKNYDHSVSMLSTLGESTEKVQHEAKILTPSTKPFQPNLGKQNENYKTKVSSFEISAYLQDSPPKHRVLGPKKSELVQVHKSLDIRKLNNSDARKNDIGHDDNHQFPSSFTDYLMVRKSLSKNVCN